jgi:hypothetical protein
MSFLTNGNILITWFVASTGSYYAIVNPNSMLAAVAATQLGAYAPATGSISSQALAGGGFAVIYPTAAATATIATYANTGGSALYTATVTVGSLAGLVIGQLPNGNIAAVYTPATTTNVAVGIYNTSLVVQYGPVSIALGAAAAGTNGLQITSAGIFGVVSETASTVVCAVFNSSAQQQGATVTIPTSTGLGSLGFLTDGTNFWVVCSTSTAYVPSWTQITPAGVATTYTGVGTNMTEFFTSCYDGMGNIVTFSGPYYTVFNINLLSQIIPPTSIADSSNSVGTGFALSVGDGAVAVLCQNASSVAYFSIWKCINTAILGPALAPAAKGASVQARSGAGFYQITALKGSAVKSFTMATGANIFGNYGSIAGIGATLGGL